MDEMARSATHVRWAGRLRHQLRVQELGEFSRQELAGVVGVQGSDYAHGGGRVAAGVRVHGGNERPDLVGRLRLGLEKVHELEPGVVVHEYQSVLVAAEERSHERADDVRVHQSSSVRRLVLRVRVGEARGVGLRADGARQTPRCSDVLGGVRGAFAEPPQVIE